LASRWRSQLHAAGAECVDLPPPLGFRAGGALGLCLDAGCALVEHRRDVDRRGGPLLVVHRVVLRGGAGGCRRGWRAWRRFGDQVRDGGRDICQHVRGRRIAWRADFGRFRRFLRGRLGVGDGGRVLSKMRWLACVGWFASGNVPCMAAAVRARFAALPVRTSMPLASTRSLLIQPLKSATQSTRTLPWPRGRAARCRRTPRFARG